MRLSKPLVFLACISLVFLALPLVSGQTGYTVTITIQGLPNNVNTTIFVDGTSRNVTLSGGQSRVFNFSGSATHYVVVQAYVPDSGRNGTRYFVKDTSWSFSTSNSHVFTYTTQYQLRVQTPYSTGNGDGWYDSGSSAQVKLKENEADEGQDTRHVFLKWIGDASGTGLTSNSILMNGPKTAVAAWKTQFYLTIESDPSNVKNISGSGWYDEGTQANISVAPVFAATEDTRLRFDNWSGAYHGQSPAGTIIMDRPKSIKAHYLAQYLLAVQFDPASIQSSYDETHTGWYDANANVQLGPAPLIINASSVERLRFSGWIQNSTSQTEPSITIMMSSPRKVTLSYKTQYYVDVRSSYGTVTGSSWYDKGSSATISVTSTAGSWPFTHNFVGWTVNPSTGKLGQDGNSWTLLVDSPYALQANWNADYTPVITIVGGGTSLIVIMAVASVVARRRGLFRRGPNPRTLKSISLQSAPESMRICSECGSEVPEDATFCQKCGAAVEAIPLMNPLEEKVYNYIVKHEGVISLSKASSDLGISVAELNQVTAKLKKEGRLA
jgi:hypothetical protein